MENLRTKTIEFLKRNKEYIIENGDNGVRLDYIKLNKHIEELTPELINYLAGDTYFFENYFKKIGDVHVFNQNLIMKILFKYKEYMMGSVTSYDNKIGLFVQDNDQVVLNFPYKDCVLVGGMDSEDEKIGTEFFYNEILDKDKISKLFQPKVFHNAKKFSYVKSLAVDDDIQNTKNIQVENDIESIDFKDGKLNDNLLMKGNNLLALHSLSERLSNSVDVIYIDPPYYFNDKKEKDSFSYNSNFKLSTWLTFMKNRLEVARGVLSENGVIFISINEDGNNYLKLLCDDIFINDNFISNLIWKKTYTLKNDKKDITNQQEYIIMYSKNKELVNINKDSLKDSYIKKNYKNPDNDPRGLWMSVQLYKKKNPTEYEIISPSGKKWIKPWNYNKEGFNKLIKEKRVWWGNKGDSCPRKKVYLKESKGQGFGSFLPEESVGYTGDGGNYIESIGFNKKDFMYTKPVNLIKYLLKICSLKNSIILDFFAGSGTTAQSVLSLNKEDGGNRKFILVEQMDYIENITAERIRRCMIKEGYEDSFIYLEMFESEIKKIKKQIKSAESIKDLEDIVNKVFDTGCFININSKSELLLEIKNRKNINDAKKILLEGYMDNNLDYVSYSDIEELKYKNLISENEYKLNKDFYNGGKNE